MTLKAYKCTYSTHTYTHCEFVLSFQLPTTSPGYLCMKDNHCSFSIIYQTQTQQSVFLTTKLPHINQLIGHSHPMYLNKTPNQNGVQKRILCFSWLFVKMKYSSHDGFIFQRSVNALSQPAIVKTPSQNNTHQIYH